MPRGGNDRRQPGPAALPAPARPAPGAGAPDRERDRYLRNPADRDSLRPRPPAVRIDPGGGAMREQQLQQQQMQRLQEQRVRDLQVRQPAANAAPAMGAPMPRVQPPLPAQRPRGPGELGHIPRTMERPAMPMREPRALPQREQRERRSLAP